MYLHSDGVKSVTFSSRELLCHAGTTVKGGTLLGTNLLKFTKMQYFGNDNKV